jgi:hypothetical protein
MQDIELPSEEILEDKTVGFSTIEFSTIYENYLHGIDMHNTRKSSSEEDKKSEPRDFESTNIPDREPPVEKCTPSITDSQLCGSSTADVGADFRYRADEFAILDEGVERNPPRVCDVSRRLQKGRVKYSLLPRENSDSTTGKSQIIAHAPPGELGLTIIGDSKSGLVQVHRIKFSSPLRSFIQEGDVLESVDGQSTTGLTSTQTSSVISSRANNTTRTLVFVRNVDESSNPTVEQSFEVVKVIVYAPPGELGLAFESDTENGQLIVHSVKTVSLLHGKIQEGDVLEYVDGESTSDLTATQALSLISSRASNPLRSLAFKRNTEV